MGTKVTPGQRRRILDAIANNGELVRKSTDRMFWTAVERMRAAGLVTEVGLKVTDDARAAVDPNYLANLQRQADTTGIAALTTVRTRAGDVAAALIAGDDDAIDAIVEQVDAELLAVVRTGRQFCRTTIHDCIPAVTLTFDGGTRRLHWCEEHKADAERYRGHSDQADTVRTVAIPARPAIGVEDAVGNPLDEGDAVELLGDEGRMYAVSHADPEGRGVWVYPLGVSPAPARQVSVVEVRKQVFENVEGVVKYVPATPVEADVDAEDGDGWGQPDGMLGATEAERFALLAPEVLAISKAADLFELACATGVDIDVHARALHDLMRPYFSGLLAEAITLGIATGQITPETDHPVRIDGPARTGQHWGASCAACYAEGTGYEEVIEVVAAALGHGPLAAGALRALDDVEPDDEDLADYENLTELAALIVAGPRSAMVEQTLKDTLDAIGTGKPIA